MNRKGFTLIEMIVVIAILGIIAGGMVALTFPLLKMQKKTATQKELGEIENGLKLFYLDHGCFPNATSWNTSLEKYTGKSGTEISKDGWHHNYQYKGYTPFSSSGDSRIQEVTIISYGANNKADGNYNSFPGVKGSGSDDLVLNVSHTACAQDMVEKTKPILEDMAKSIYSACLDTCNSTNGCQNQCTSCVNNNLSGQDAWQRTLKHGSFGLVSSDKCWGVIYSEGDDPTTDGDDVKISISWWVSDGGSGSGSGGSTGGGGSGGNKGKHKGWGSGLGPVGVGPHWWPPHHP